MLTSGNRGAYLGQPRLTIRYSVLRDRCDDLLKGTILERAYSSVWLERTPDKREVTGSSPVRPTTLNELKMKILTLTIDF